MNCLEKAYEGKGRDALMKEKMIDARKKGRRRKKKGGFIKFERLGFKGMSCIGVEANCWQRGEKSAFEN